MVRRKEVIRYIEQKTDGGASLNDRGPAFISKVLMSKGFRIYFKGKTLLRGTGVAGNYTCLEDGDEYWVSGVKKRGSNRHPAGGGPVVIEVSKEELDAELGR